VLAPDLPGHAAPRRYRDGPRSPRSPTQSPPTSTNSGSDASTSWVTRSAPAWQSSWPPANGPARLWQSPPPGSTPRPSGSTRAR
jgi:hypothetical protein